MRLKPNMYVRTKWGINKINEYVPQSGQLYLKTDVCHKSNVYKASYDIIDLIEVGDYVNGYYVEDVLESFINVATGSNYFQSPTIYENDIKSIVTKEQFESISYKEEK